MSDPTPRQLSQLPAATISNDSDLLLTQQVSDNLSKQTTAELVRKPAIQAIQSCSPMYSADTGSANAYVATLTPAITGYAPGMVLLDVVNANTGASTINVNGLGIKNIKYMNGAALVGGELQIGMTAQLFYDGTNFQLLNPFAITQNASIYKAADQTGITGGLVPTTLLFDTPDYDNNGLFFLADNGIKIKTAGRYLITTRSLFEVISGDIADVVIELSVNGTPAIRLDQRPNTGAEDFILTGSDIILCAANAVLTIDVSQDGTSTPIIKLVGGNAYNSFSIMSL